MRIPLIRLSLTLALFAALLPITSHSQSILSYTVASNYNCGRASNPLYCLGVPVTLAGDTKSSGNFWIDSPFDTKTGLIANSGFIQWQNGLAASLGKSAIRQNVGSYNTAGQLTSLTTIFTGAGYAGQLSLNMAYYYSSGGGGRGGAGAGWRYIITGGTVTIIPTTATGGAPPSGTSAMSGPIAHVTYCGGGTSGYWTVGVAGYGPLATPYKVCSYYGQYYGPRITITWAYYYWFLAASPWTDVGN